MVLPVKGMTLFWTFYPNIATTSTEVGSRVTTYAFPNFFQLKNSGKNDEIHRMPWTCLSFLA